MSDVESPEPGGLEIRPLRVILQMVERIRTSGTGIGSGRIDQLLLRFRTRHKVFPLPEPLVHTQDNSTK